MTPSAGGAAFRHPHEQHPFAAAELSWNFLLTIKKKLWHLGCMSAQRPTTFEELRELVDRRGGIHRISMGDLRDINGAGKLGIHVVTQIKRSLSRAGLSILLPAGQADMPRYQEEYVVIYLTQSKVGEVIEAVHEADFSAVKLLRDLASDNSAEKLQAIRDILDE
jgi:hypothetical protein